MLVRFDVEEKRWHFQKKVGGGIVCNFKWVTFNISNQVLLFLQTFDQVHPIQVLTKFNQHGRQTTPKYDVDQIYEYPHECVWKNVANIDNVNV